MGLLDGVRIEKRWEGLHASSRPQLQYLQAEIMLIHESLSSCMFQLISSVSFILFYFFSWHVFYDRAVFSTHLCM